MLKLILLTLGVLATAVAYAQTEPTSPARQRAANRQALREARRTEADYKDSHLAVSRRQLKRGASTPLEPVADEPRFSRDGTPHVTEPKYPGLRLRRPKTDLSH